MADYEIKIKTTAVGDGAQKTAEGLTKVTTAAKETAPAQAKLTEETDKATISKGKLAVAVQKLSHEFPILGAVAGLIKHPIIGLAAAIAFLIRAIHKQIEAQNELAQSAADEAASLTTLLNKLNRHREQAVEWKTSQEDLATAMGKVSQQALASDKVIARQITQIEARLDLEKKEIESKKKIALAELELERIRSGMADDEFERRKAGIEGRFGGMEAGANAAAAAQKQDVLAKQHFKDIQDQKNALDAELAFREDEKKAKTRLADFDRAEEVRAPKRKLARDDAQKELAAALKQQTERDESMNRLKRRYGPGPYHREQQFDIDVVQGRIEESELRVAQAAMRKRGEGAVEQQFIGQRAELASDLAGTTKLRSEAISAAARAGTSAEMTRQGVITSVQDQGLANKIAQMEAEKIKAIGAIDAQTAFLKEKAKAEEKLQQQQEEMARRQEQSIRRIDQLMGREH